LRAAEQRNRLEPARALSPERRTFLQFRSDLRVPMGALYTAAALFFAYRLLSVQAKTPVARPV
jgi:hypothetical protein